MYHLKEFSTDRPHRFVQYKPHVFAPTLMPIQQAALPPEWACGAQGQGRGGGKKESSQSQGLPLWVSVSLPGSNGKLLAGQAGLPQTIVHTPAPPP